MILSENRAHFSGSCAGRIASTETAPMSSNHALDGGSSSSLWASRRRAVRSFSALTRSRSDLGRPKRRRFSPASFSLAVRSLSLRKRRRLMISAMRSSTQFLGNLAIKVAVRQASTGPGHVLRLDDAIEIDRADGTRLHRLLAQRRAVFVRRLGDGGCLVVADLRRQ